MGKKFQVNKSFFKKWTSDSAYVLGFFCADGNLENASAIRGKYVRFTSTDRHIVEDIRKAMSSMHVIYKMQPKTGKIRHLLRIGDPTLYTDLFEKHKLTPSKSLTMTFPKVPKKYLKHFIRGYFDGDGCVSIEYAKLKDQRRSIKRLHTSFTSGSESFLSELNKKLKDEISIESKLYKNGNTKQLRYSTKASVLLFKFLYLESEESLFLNRKFNKFRFFFKKRKNWIDDGVQSILDDYQRSC